MRQKNYKSLYREITRKDNAIDINEMSDVELVECILGNSGAKVLEYVGGNPHLWDMTAKEMVQVLSNVKGVGVVGAQRFVMLQIYCARRVKYQKAAQKGMPIDT